MIKQRRQYINLFLFVGIWALAILTPHLTKGRTLSRFGNQPDTAIQAVVSVEPLEIKQIPVTVDSVPLIDIPFIDSLCVVSDPTESLASFFGELNLLLNRKDTVISIVHLGDSHIQAGYYTGRVMRRMQEQFGNAGRGWVTPLKLSKVNEPDDYFIQSVVKEWVTGRCIQQNPKTQIGIGGLGIRTESPSVNMDIVIGPVNGAGYTFNQAILYRSEKAMPLLPAGNLKDSVKTFLGADASVAGVLADTFRITCLTDTLQLHSTRRKQGTDSLLPAASFDNVYYGFELRNGGSGILYHSIGINGAMFIHYTDADYLRQLALLNPALLIVSLGTNESFGRRFTTAEFSGQVSAFVSLVKQYLPHTTLLLTTPAECYKRVTINKKRTYVRNENTERAARAIVDVAREQGLACWDLFSATGGKNSHKKWFEKKLMGRDRIHFNKEGYHSQGELLFRALMKSYNQQIIPNAPQEEEDNSRTIEENEDELV